MSSAWYKKLSNGIRDDTYAVWAAFIGTRENPSNVGIYANNDYIINEKMSGIIPQQEDGSQNTKTILDQGFSEIEKQKAIAINEFDRMNRKYNDILTKTKSAIDPSTYSDELDYVKKQLEEKKVSLDEISKKFNSYKNDNFNRLSDSLTFKSAEKTINPDLVAGQSVYGWGEIAQQLGQEEIEQNLNSRNNEPSDAQRRLNEIRKITKNGWFSINKELEDSERSLAEHTARGLRGWGESAEAFSRDELEDLKSQVTSIKNITENNLNSALEKLKDAEKKVRDTQNSWWSKSTEESIHEVAVKNYEVAREEYDKAMKDFDVFENKLNNISVK